jgi:hypothetical protein
VDKKGMREDIFGSKKGEEAATRTGSKNQDE